MTLAIEGLVLTTVGAICLRYWRQMGRRAFQYQERIFGKKAGHVVWYQRSYLVAGVIFLVIGLLGLAEVIRFGRAP